MVLILLLAARDQRSAAQGGTSAVGPSIIEGLLGNKQPSTIDATARAVDGLVEQPAAVPNRPRRLKGVTV